MKKIDEIRIIRTNRRSLALEITRDMEILVRAPLRISDDAIRKFVQEKSGWIEKQLLIMEEKMGRQENLSRERLSVEENRKLAEKALQVIPERVEFLRKCCRSVTGGLPSEIRKPAGEAAVIREI